ncbi:MAG: 16S rRNA (guanine(527)-N(7))-methyltransferase RsmG [Cyanobium sp. NAT70]|nr:16S rRNA (guanine(527)-N(7))-methyltransferase RsmG [Cyanobium sp. NAT70]|tara:strand:+ start:5182 stop:5925 length:744 start_codon:yes stop_codon:yes gene_type:complete
MSDSIGRRDDLWQALNWQPSATQKEQLTRLQALLRDWNTRVNLTRLVEGEDYWINQIFDSLWPLQEELQHADQPRRCIDVGTGGGFPGLAIAIALPGAQLTLLDSVGRKTAAVAAMAMALGLSPRVRIRTERIEATGRDPAFRGHFDLAVARAVASAPVVAEYLVPLIRPDGEALLYRGQWSDTDTHGLERALEPLKGCIRNVQQCQLPGERGIRHILRISSLSTCPKKYPRPIGVPSKFPLDIFET